MKTVYHVLFSCARKRHFTVKLGENEELEEDKKKINVLKKYDDGMVIISKEYTNCHAVSGPFNDRNAAIVECEKADCVHEVHET